MSRRAARRLAACAFALTAAAGAAEPSADAAWPAIREITFSGNETTQPDVLLREFGLHVGDAADPARLEHGRQAIQDLRLFDRVTLRQDALADGVAVRIAVKEKYYVLPLPRASLNSDGQYDYGVGMRWWNVFGLNHTLHMTVEQGNRQEAGRGTQLQYQASYDIPFLFDSPYGLTVDYSHSDAPITDVVFGNERLDTARGLVTRALGEGSHGWRVGAGLQWQDLQRTGIGLASAPGQATALLLRAEYDDVTFRLYSEEGPHLVFEASATPGGVASDYSYQELVGSYEQSWRVGDTPHQTLGLFAQGGAYFGGASGELPAFSLGGSDNLRGYPLNFLRGDRYYYGGIEFARPMHWDWLRGVVFVEGGDAFGDGLGPDGSFADAGFGVRLRLTGFVRTEFNLGFAWPLVDGGDGTSPRFFGTGHR